MMRVVLLVLVLLLVTPSPIDAGKRRHERHPPRTVVIEDRTAAVWSGLVAPVVAEFDALIPPRGPRLRYIRGGGGCDAGTATRIIVCSVPSLGEGLGSTEMRRGVVLSDEYVWRGYLCHGLMHILTGIRDNYGARADSCVWGEMASPGAFDAAQVRKHYKRHR